MNGGGDRFRPKDGMATGHWATWQRKLSGRKKANPPGLPDLAPVIQEIIAAPGLDQALACVVRHVRVWMAVDACEIYLTERETGMHRLRAAEGLREGLVGSVCFRFGEGLIGRVAESAGPITVDRAAVHPDYVFGKKTGEADFQGFLGVPLTHQGLVLGILAVRQRDRRHFDAADEAFLVTIAAQLAGSVAYAQAVDVSGGEYTSSPGIRCLNGQAGAPGIAIGTGVVVFHPARFDEVPERAVDDIEQEMAVFTAALDQVIGELGRVGSNLASVETSALGGVLDAYVMMLQSEEFQGRILERIQAGSWAPWALRQTVEEYCQYFADMEDPYLCERGSDLYGLGQRMLNMLLGRRREPVFPPKTILLGQHLTVMDLAEVPPECLAGIVCTQGSTLSHIAIVAQARGIPAVVGIGEVSVQRLDGKRWVVDGYQGRLHIEPSERIMREFERIQKSEWALDRALDQWREGPAITTDGARVALGLNIGSSAEVEMGQGVHADGVGLFRTEFAFMLNERFPSESEQADTYRQVLAAFAPRPVTIRTLDAGGDKALPYLSVPEDNPFLGWRGIRMTLDHPEIFAGQIRAVLRASRGYHNARLLLPMISGLPELERALELFERTYDRFIAEEGPAERPAVGAMIEVPSAVWQAEAIAGLVDFLSVGTNDLTQYLLAVDRGNRRVARLLEPFHPAVLHALHGVAEAAARAGKSVACCGEMASDPVAIPFLIGCGFRELSMHAAALPRARWVVRSFSTARLADVVREVLPCDRADAARGILIDVLKEEGLGGLVYPGG